MRNRRLADWRSAAIALLLLGSVACAGSGEGSGDPVRMRVRTGAPFSEVADTLAALGVIENAGMFRLYARFTGKARLIKPGTYEFRRDAGWEHVLAELIAGHVVTRRLVIPEGLRLEDIALRMAEFTGADAESLHTVLADTAAARLHEVPGPTLEGYLYPATYTLPIDAGTDALVGALVDAYHRIWTAERRALADSLGLSEREVVTLASIIEKEAVRHEEMPLISAVYHNRLRIGMALQADPTVQYALGGHRERLLYADIEKVRDHPYNTYARPGLPPGPIAAPAERAIDAALQPADADYLFFVARRDGSHVFSRTLAEHNRARIAIRREQRESSGSTR